MNRWNAIVAVCLCAAFISMSGCGPDARQGDDALPSPVISDAMWDIYKRDVVQIKGAYFKVHSDNKADVVESTTGERWVAAKSIVKSSGLDYTAQLPYGPDFPQVWVRVYGLNGQYSQPYLIHN